MRDFVELEKISVGRPCRAGWEAMKGTDQVRFCGTCSKNVYNLSAMTRSEAEALIHQHEGKVCVRFYQRTDGTLMTSDCPVGTRQARRWSAPVLRRAFAPRWSPPVLRRGLGEVSSFGWLASGFAALATWGIALAQQQPSQPPRPDAASLPPASVVLQRATSLGFVRAVINMVSPPPPPNIAIMGEMAMPTPLPAPTPIATPQG